MRRTAALLTLPLFLVVALDEHYDAASDGNKVRLYLDGERVNPSSIPARHPWIAASFLLLAAAGVRKKGPGFPALQAVGTILLLTFWLGLALRSRDAQSLVLQSIAFLGMAALSLWENIVGPRRPVDPDPGRRLAIGLLGILAAAEGADAALNSFDSMTSAWFFTFHWLSMVLLLPLGIVATYFLSMWGLWNRTRWAPWLGLVVVSWLGGTALWKVGAHPFQPSEDPGLYAWVFLTAYFSNLLIQASAAILLALRIRRDWSTRRHDEAAKG